MSSLERSQDFSASLSRAQLDALHPSITDARDDVYTPSGIRDRRKEDPEQELERRLEGVRQEAEEIFLPMKDIHDLRLQINTIRTLRKNFATLEEKEEIQRALVALRSNPFVRQLLGSYPKMIPDKINQDPLLSMHREIVEVTWTLIQDFPKLLSRVRQLYEAYSALLPVEGGRRWKEQHEKTTWSMCNMGSYTNIQLMTEIHAKELYEMRITEMKRLQQQLEEESERIKQLEQESDHLAGEAGAVAIMEVHLRRKAKIEGAIKELSGRIYKKQIEWRDYVESKLSFLTPLQWVLEDILDPETLQLLSTAPRSSSPEDEAFRKKYSLSLDKRAVPAEETNFFQGFEVKE